MALLSLIPASGLVISFMNLISRIELCTPGGSRPVIDAAHGDTNTFLSLVPSW